MELTLRKARSVSPRVEIQKQRETFIWQVLHRTKSILFLKSGILFIIHLKASS